LVRDDAMDRDKGMRHPSQNFPLLDGSWVSAWPNTPTGEESSSARTSCHRRVLQKPFWGTSAANRIGENAGGARCSPRRRFLGNDAIARTTPTGAVRAGRPETERKIQDRKSTRLNSSH